MNRRFALVLLCLALTPLAATAQYNVTTFSGSTTGGGHVDADGTAARFSMPLGLAIDPAGTLYVGDSRNHVIRRVTRDGRVTTIAGKAGESGTADGQGTAARFNRPSGLALDSAGILYVADQVNHAIRRITPAGNVSTIAGKIGTSGTADGTGTAAQFTFPTDVAVDSAGNIYVADTSNHAIRKIAPGNIVTTLAGSKRTSGNGDGFGTQARFFSPWAVAVDAAGNVYVADTNNNLIRRVTPEGRVTTVAGNPTNDEPGSKDGIGVEAEFSAPSGIDVDASGNLWVADTWNHTLRKITPSAQVSTLAGQPEVYGQRNSIGLDARFYAPTGIVVDPAGGFFIADRFNHAIRKVDTGFNVGTLAGSMPTYGVANATGTNSRYFYPEGVTVDPSGNVFVVDFADAVRKITPSGQASLFAGAVDETGGTDGAGAVARFYAPRGIASDSAGNLYVADTYNHTIRKITPAGVVSTIAGVAGQFGYANGTGTQARFYYPHGVAVDDRGNVYVGDTYNHRIRIIEPTGVVTTLAGGDTAGYFDGIGENADFRYPMGLAVDAARNVYVADWGNNVIRKIATNGQVSTVAGLRDQEGFRDGTKAQAIFDEPRAVAVRSDGTLFVVEDEHHSIRRIDPAGNVTTVAGIWETPGNVDGNGPNARLSFPQGLAFDRQGRLFIADSENHAIRLATGAPPVIISFTATPQVINTVRAVTLNWTTSGATLATLNGASMPVSGSTVVTPAQTTTYTLVVMGEGGTTSQSVTVVFGNARRRSVGK